MNADAFRQVYDYHFAENHKLWEYAIAGLSQAHFTQAADYAQGAVRDQLLHLIDVDEAWFSGLRKREPGDAMPPEQADDRQAIRARWDAIEQDMRAYLATLRDEDLFAHPIQEPEEDRFLMTWQVLLQVINHGTDHRAQLLRQLNDLGVHTWPQDYIFYAYEHRLP